jgi:hypothetical protein
VADRTFYRDPVSGQFISAAQAAELERAVRVDFRGGIRTEAELEYGEEPEEEEEEYEPAYTIEPSRWGQRWDVRGTFDDLANERMPEGATGWRPTYNVPEGPEGSPYWQGYMRGGWFTPSEWPPTPQQAPHPNITGIAYIVFDLGD